MGAVVLVVVENHDDFTRPVRNAVEGAADARRLIAGDDADGNG